MLRGISAVALLGREYRWEMGEADGEFAADVESEVEPGKEVCQLMSWVE